MTVWQCVKAVSTNDDRFLEAVFDLPTLEFGIDDGSELKYRLENSLKSNKNIGLNKCIGGIFC